MKMRPPTIQIMNKRREIDDLRQIERDLALSSFQRGQLSGAQQVLWWLCGDGLEPIAAFLSPQDEAQARQILGYTTAPHFSEKSATCPTQEDRR
jgi:hypothetical protein